MPLQLVFHLETAKPTAITAEWDADQNRLRVVKIDGNFRFIHELREHAIEAGYGPSAVVSRPIQHVDDDGNQWVLLKRYAVLEPELQKEVDAAFAELFGHLTIEQESTVGKHRVMTQIRVYMTKPDGTNTKAWVWNDTLIWIEAIT